MEAQKLSELEQLLLSNPDEVERTIRRVRARRGLLNFIKYTKDDYEVNWHHKLICDEVDAFLADPKRNRLMIFTGPRRGKSEIISRRLPAYIFGKNPNLQIIATSYGAELAQAMNRDVQRIIDSPTYQELFPATRLSGKNVKTTSLGSYVRTSDKFEIVGYKGVYRSAGVGGGITGQGADCFRGDTRILTDRGHVKISEIVESGGAYNVASYNHDLKQLQYKQVIAVQGKRTDKELVKIRTVQGCEFVCTADHPIFTNEGYREARLLSIGDTLIQESVSNEQKLPSLPNNDYIQKSNLSSMLLALSKSACSFRMFFLSKRICSSKIRVGQENKKFLYGYLLLNNLFKQTPCRKEQTKMPNLPDTCFKKDHEVLFKKVQTFIVKTGKNLLLNLQEKASTFKSFNEVLFHGLQEQTSLTFNGWKWQSEVQRWYSRQVPFIIQETQALHSKKRQALCDLFINRCVARSPYRREQTEQPTRELDNTLSYMSHDTSQVSYDTVSSIERIGTTEDYVYDIEVDENHNFFAEGILVHNCAIIDDPFKDWQEATSNKRRQLIKDWYGSTLYTRLSPNAKVIIINTRWHEDDLSGWLMKEAEVNKEADQWEIISLPEIQDEHNLHQHPKDLRKDGDILWPTKFTETQVSKIKASVGSKIWSALFQQRPSPDGGQIVKGEWFQYFKDLPKDETAYYISSWDCAFKDTSTSDYVVGQVWYVCGSNKYLVYMVRERLDIVATIREMLKTGQLFNLRSQIIEDKANGPAIISMLKNKIPGLIAFNPEGSKEARANAVAPQFEAGNIWLPDKYHAPNRQNFATVINLLDAFVNEFKTFPNGANDDMVDATTQVLLKIGHKVGWLDELIEQAHKKASQGPEFKDKVADVMGWNLQDDEPSVFGLDDEDMFKIDI